MTIQTHRHQLKYFKTQLVHHRLTSGKGKIYPLPTRTLEWKNRGKTNQRKRKKKEINCNKHLEMTFNRIWRILTNKLNHQTLREDQVYVLLNQQLFLCYHQSLPPHPLKLYPPVHLKFIWMHPNDYTILDDNTWNKKAF